MSKPFMICNLIVKNEGHIIEETLNSIMKYVDYFVISDTGSTDNTIEIIRKFFENNNKKGEIYLDEWKNFGHNRSISLKYCFGKSEYIWVIDADDLIIGNLILPENMDADCYELTYGEDFTYKRVQIFKNDAKLNWKYMGVVHEYPVCDKNNYVKKAIEGKYYIDSRRLGARSQDPEKYLRDALLLEEELKVNPKNERDMFYLAQSYFDYHDYKKSIECYQKRIDMQGWYEEVFYSYYKIAQAKQNLNQPWSEIEKAYIDAYNYCKIRGAEPLYNIAFHYRMTKDFKKGYYWSKIGSKIPYPNQCVLFIFKDIYQFKIWDELLVNAYYIENYVESFQICKKLLSLNIVPSSEISRIKNNMRCANEKLNLMEKEMCIVYLGNKILDSSSEIFWDFVDTMNNCYDVIIVSNKLIRNTNILIISDEFFKNNFKYLKINILVLFDNINILFQDILITKKIVLVQLDDNFKAIAKNGLNILVENGHYLKDILFKISKILCFDLEIKRSLINKFNIKDNLIYLYDKLEIHKILEKDGNIKMTISNNNFNYGLIYEFPKYIENIKTEDTDFCKNIMLNLINDFQELFENYPEPYYYLAKYYNRINQTDLATKLLEKCNNMISKSGIDYKYYHQLINAEKAKIFYSKSEFVESFNICQKILKNFYFDEETQIYIENIKDLNIEKIKDEYLIYPKNKIKKINKNQTEKDQKKIILSMTSCKRYDLFEKTINSFINCCNDVHRIDYWLCVDDNSSQDDKIKMKTNYPFINYIFKTEDKKGHYKSMNIIYDFITDNNCDFLIHLEDDWHFIEKRDYITECINILNGKTYLGQILFNRNYAEVEPYKIRIPGGFICYTKNGNRYIEHEYYLSGTDEYNRFINKYPNQGTNAYWPYFSFRPSIMKCDMLRKIGYFPNTAHFELEYAKEYNEYGYKSGFIDTFSCIHIGKKTWEKEKENAYNLNNILQFDPVINITNINIISKNINDWKIFKNSTINVLPPYKKYFIHNIKQLDSTQMKIFQENKFKYDREILSELWTHFNIWKNDNNNFTIIINEKTTLSTDFANKLDCFINYLSKNDNIDFAILSDEKEINQDYIIAKTLENITNLSCYLISNKTKKKIVEYVNNFGIKENLLNFLNNILNEIDITKNQILPNLFIAHSDNYKLSHIDLNNYNFYSQLDSFGNDLNYYSGKNIIALHELCENDTQCVGFNTYGWLKYKINPESEFIFLPNSNPHDGLYVKKFKR